MDKTNQDRILYFDVLNILACISVIALHHNGLVHSFENTRAWKESLVVECAFYWAVPVFLMISGANLLTYREKYSTAIFFKKRIKRTVIPWLMWSVVMLMWKLGTHQMELEYMSIGYVMNLIFNYKVETIYWFFGSLFGCYLAMPIFSTLVKNRNILWYTVIVNFILLSCLPALKTWLGFSWGIDVPIAGSLIIYVILGYLLATQTLEKWWRITIYILGFAGFLFRFVYTYIFSIKNGKTDVSIKGYVMFHAVFLAVAVFVWGKHVRWNRFLPQWLIKKIPKISSYSFGIFLIHKIVMYYERTFLSMSVKSHAWRSGMILITYFISLGIVYVLKKIPYIGKFIC